MAKNPLIRSYPRRVSKPLPNKSAGILDDFAVRKVVATKEGSITKTPTADIDIVNKKFVDDKLVESFPTSLTTGSVVFSDGTNLSQDNFNLFWDDANKRLEPNLIKITSDGTQASPALKFNDTNTGFFKSGDSVRLSLNNNTITNVSATGLNVTGDISGDNIFTTGNIGVDSTAPTSVLPNGFSASNPRVIEILQNAGNEDVGLFMRRLDKAVGIDLWYDISVGAGFFDLRWDNALDDLNFRFRTSDPATDMFTAFQLKANFDHQINGQLTINNGTPFGAGRDGLGKLHIVGGEGDNCELEMWADDGDNNADRFKLEANIDGSFNMQIRPAGTYFEMITMNQTEVVINNEGNNIDFRVAGSTEDKLLLVDAGVNEVRMGDGDTNFLAVNDFGKAFFEGPTSGLPFAEIYARDNTTTTSTSTTKAQVLIFDTDGESNLMTPSHAQDHITVIKAGKYKIDTSISIKNSSGAAHVINVEMYKNNGTVVFNNIHAGRTLGTGTDVGNLTMSGIVDLAINDTIEIWITSDSGAARTVTVEDIDFCAIQIGGT